jgi:diguanylate cyclase (GGDEF)-like protein
VVGCRDRRRYHPENGAAAIEIFRQPLWHETGWSSVLAVLATIALLVAGERLLARRAQRREAQLKKLVDLRTVELREALVRVETHSRIDSLTGLANRRHLDERLRAIWNLALRSGRPVSAIMVDTDYFKQYNDTLGHSAGDDCLKRVSAALADGLTREHDVVARYGGDEFLIVLYDSDQEGAAHVAQRILDRVRQLRLPHPENPAADHVTISAGYTTCHPQEGQDPHSLIDGADQALYRAKSAGRNCTAGDHSTAAV